MHPDLLSFVVIFDKDNEHTANVALECERILWLKARRTILKAANWTFRSFDGVPVFAIYSTEDQLTPTILYEAKGERAEFERDILNKLLEEINYVERVVGKSEVINEILNGGWMRKDSGYFDGYGAVGRGRSVGDAGVLRQPSKRKPSAAFKSVLRNLFSIRAGRVK